jgi:hypothetical protein
MAFFLITIILIVCAVYVNFRGLPIKRQKLLEEQFVIHRTETQAQQQFVQQMESARLLLDSLDKGGKNKVQLQADLGGKLTNMERLKQSDTSLNGKLNAAVLNAFIELQGLKAALENHQVLVSRVNDLQNQLDICNAALDTYRSRAQQIPEQ